MPIPFLPLPMSAIVGAGAAFAVAGYTLQEILIARHKLRAGSTLPRLERRRVDRATEAAGATLEQQAEDLAAAIDVMVAFVDGPPRSHRARACAKQIAALVTPERRGSMTVRFLEMVEAEGALPELQKAAEEVCLQMALELRGIITRARDRPGQVPLTLESLHGPVPAPAAEEPSASEAEPPPPEPARPTWELAEAEIAMLRSVLAPAEPAADRAPEAGAPVLAASEAATEAEATTGEATTAGEATNAGEITSAGEPATVEEPAPRRARARKSPTGGAGAKSAGAKSTGAKSAGAKRAGGKRAATKPRARRPPADTTPEPEGAEV